MPLSPELSPRKQPVQQRSKDTMDRIIDAATRVLTEYGYDGASTNRIAAEAKISNGSLYQYFPNKDAIVVAVLERFADQLVARLNPQVEEALAVPWRDGIRAVSQILFEVFDANADMLGTVLRQIPDLTVLDKLAAFQRRMTDLTRMYLLVHRGQFRDDLDIDATVWILAEITIQLTTRYVVHRPPIPRDRLINELAELTIRYLDKDK